MKLPCIQKVKNTDNIKTADCKGTLAQAPMVEGITKKIERKISPHVHQHTNNEELRDSTTENVVILPMNSASR